MDKEDKKAESIPFNDTIMELPESNPSCFSAQVFDIRFFDRYSGFDNLNKKRVLQMLKYNDKGDKEWVDVPITKEN